jgi:hypothetical protein
MGEVRRLEAAGDEEKAPVSVRLSALRAAIHRGIWRKVIDLPLLRSGCQPLVLLACLGDLAAVLPDRVLSLWRIE